MSKLLSASYNTNWSREPVIHLYGVGGYHKTFIGFLPYFYVQFNNHIDEEVGRKLLHSHHFYDIKKVERYMPIGYQKHPSMMFKIILEHPSQIREARDRAAQIPNIHKVYEADIPYVARYLIDHELGGFSDIGGPEDALIKHLGFDIECLVEEDGKMPDPNKQPIIVISMAFSPSYNGVDRIILTGRASSYDGCKVVVCSDEEDLINTFFLFLKGYNPDIIAGYNTNSFDIPYIDKRCKILNINPNVTRDNRNWYIKDKFDGGVDVTITGRVVVDLLPIIRANYSLSQYNLKTVASLVNYEKLDVSPQDMRKAYIGEGDWNQTIAYSDRDAELVMKLLIELKLIDKYIAISKASGTLLQDVVNLGQTKLIDNLIMKEFRKRGRVMNMRPHFEEEDDGVGYSGGSVLDVDIGMHEDVIILDFTSLYPTIMIAYNISPDTLLNSETCEFVPRNVTVGIVPEILENLFNKRKEYKKLMKNAKTEEERNMYDVHQYAFKILLNSIYGFFGYTRSRLYDIAIASSVTRIGRETLMKTKDVIESMEIDV